MAATRPSVSDAGAAAGRSARRSLRAADEDLGDVDGEAEGGEEADAGEGEAAPRPATARADGGEADGGAADGSAADAPVEKT